VFVSPQQSRSVTVHELQQVVVAAVLSHALAHSARRIDALGFDFIAQQPLRLSLSLSTRLATDFAERLACARWHGIARVVR
jgi:hypothetical protein